MSKIGLIIGIAGIATYICAIVLFAKSGCGGFTMCLVVLSGIWLVGCIFGFALTKDRRRYWFAMLTTAVAVLLFGACALKWYKADLRQSISTAFSGVQVSFATPEEQLKAQQSVDKQAQFLENLLDHY